MALHLRIYYVEITGRSNCIYKSIAGKELHHEIVVASSKKKAEDAAITNLLVDVDATWDTVLTRRNMKVSCEDWTFVKKRDEDYYHTEEFLRR